MNKKILLGSIIAVVILVLVSFTGVVGYQTTKSSTIAKASPLFSVRSKRAIDRDSKDIACDYVGKGEESVLSIPKRDKRTVLIQRVIGGIKRMDDNVFNKLIELHVLKDNLNEITNYGKGYERDFLTLNPICTIEWGFVPWSVDNAWSPGCFARYLLEILAMYIIGIFFILDMLYSVWTQCPTIGNIDPCITYSLPC